MKKLLLALLILVFCSAPVLAKDAFYGTVIATTKLDNDPTSVTSDGIDVSQYDKIAFYVYADETDSGNDTSAAVTLQISYDNTVWLPASFYDYAGGATLQTSETLCTGASTDQNYYFWFNKDLNVRYVRMIITGTGTASGGDDEVDVTAYYSAQK